MADQFERWQHDQRGFPGDRTGAGAARQSVHMSTQRTLVVFGASGFVGRQVVEAALRAGWAVHAFTRDASRLAGRPGLTVVEGDASDAAAVARAITGASAVVNALGPSTNRRDEIDLTVVAIRNILAGMAHHGVRRLVSLSGAAVDVAGDRKPLGARLASRLVRLFAGNVVRAKQREYEEIAASGVEWTIVRPPRVTDAPPVGRTVPGDRLYSRTVSAADLAAFMVGEIDGRDHVRGAPFVSG